QNEKVRAYLSHWTHDNSGNVGVARAAGNEAVVLRSVGQGAAIHLHEANGKVHGQFGLESEGPLLGLSDAQGKQRLTLGMTKEGPGLRILDAGGQVLFSRP